jgi:tetratricopeptide (TPR) repeat protein
MGDGVGVVGRDRLVARLHQVLTHRLTLVVADAGFGKTELLEQWLEHRDVHGAHLVRPSQKDVAGLAGAVVAAVRQRAPEVANRLALMTGPVGADHDRTDALAGVLCSALVALPGFEVVLVLDDAHLLPEPATRFVESLLRQAPATLHLLVLGRQELPFPIDRIEGGVQRLSGHDLGFDDAELSELLLKIAGDDEHAPAVRSLLGRWPAAVRLAAEQLARVPADRRTGELLRLKKHGASDLVALAREVMAGESARTRRLAQVVGPYDAFSVELAEELGCTDAAATVADLDSRGIVARLGTAEHDYFAFPRLMREFVRAELQLSPQERPDQVRRAGAWWEAHGQQEGALRCALDQQDAAWAARLLREHGRALVEQGRDTRVAQALALVGSEGRDAALEEVEGLLLDNRGDHDGALRCYARAAAHGQSVSPWLAYRTGFLHYFRGNLDASLAGFQSGRTEEESGEQALLQAWQATTLWALGQVDAAEQLAAEALALADRLQDSRSQAASHTISAMLCAHRGDRAGSRWHYDLAVEHAEHAGDTLQVIRIRNNRGAGLLEEAELDLALPELEVAIELAQASGLSFYLSAALTNRGELRFQQGQYDAAVADLERAHELDRLAGTSSSATRIYLGQVYRHRGYDNAARVAYEEVLAVGRSTGDLTLVVPALCGLAQLLGETDPARATAMVDEALSYDAGVNGVGVLTTAGWVAQVHGRLEDATRWAELALEEAVARRDRLGEAEALQLLTVSDPVLQPVDPRLERAAAIVDAVGAPVWRARVRLEQARRMPREQARAMVAQVQQLAASLGARNLADKAAVLARTIDETDSSPHLEVLTLGGFRVRCEGRSLGLTDWPDDSSAALLKRLTSVPSLSWSKSALKRSLWPGTPVEQREALLEVAAAQLRQVLDRSGRYDAEHYLADRGDALALVLVEVDVHAFMAESGDGLGVVADRDQLRRAEARYAGDYLEEHPGEEWAATLREEARARYVDVCRALAQLAVRAEDHEAAARYSRRILERDPYDEGAHLALVAALSASGRTVEARSCYASYAARLDELGLEAVPWGMVSDTVDAT